MKRAYLFAAALLLSSCSSEPTDSFLYGHEGTIEATSYRLNITKVDDVVRFEFVFDRQFDYLTRNEQGGLIPAMPLLRIGDRLKGPLEAGQGLTTLTFEFETPPSLGADAVELIPEGTTGLVERRVPYVLDGVRVPEAFR